MSKQIKDLLSYHKLKLYYSRHKLIMSASSQPKDEILPWALPLWSVSGDWHIMNIDTNADKSSGLSGGLALNTPGSFSGGIMSYEVNLLNYSEISFEHYVQNGKEGQQGETNALIFSIDGVKKLEVLGPSPWQRYVPIGLTPGRHEISFQYIYSGGPYDKKAVIDTVTIYEGAPVKCLITEYVPPKPIKELGKTGILRGFTRFQEMKAADTEISFTAIFEGTDYLHFMQKSDMPFYFVDEFGVCYRGIFPENVSPKNVAMNEVYYVELTMVAGQKTGIGFC